jgi:hypothetical protein
MRQIYSFIFIIPAIYTNIFALRWLLVSLGFFTHAASLLYAFTFGITSFQNILLNSINSLRKKANIKYKDYDPKLFLLGLAFAIVILLGFVLGQIQNIIGLSSILSGDTVDRVSVYTDDSTLTNISIASQLRTILDYGVIFLFAIVSSYNKSNPLMIRWLLLFVTIFGLYIGSLLSGFNARVASMVFCIPGFFYTIPLLSDKFNDEDNNGKVNRYVYIFCGSIILRIVYFFNNLISSYQSDSYLTFWDGQMLTTPIVSYFDFFVKCLTSR